MNTERIYEKYVGSYVAVKEFVKDGKVSEEKIEEQVQYADDQGWFDGGEIDADELRQAIRKTVSQSIA